MASGLIIPIWQVSAPATAFATLDTRAGGSTPAEVQVVYDFDASTDEYLDLYCSMPSSYDGGGLTVIIKWQASSATSGDCIWRVGIRRRSSTDDIDASKTYDFNSVTTTAPGTSGYPTSSTVTFTDGADMDSLAASEDFVLRITRDADNGSDNMSGDAELISVTIYET